MDTVFPGCLAEPVFLNALVYSITHTLSAGEVTVEGLRLEAKVIEHLMILKGVAVGRALL
jgi:hypothetical protein